MTRTARRAAAAALAALAAVAAILAADLTPPAAAQSEDETTGRIVARRLDDGRVEFGWQPSGAARVLPRQRYFPANATVDRWLRSSPVEVGGAEIGRINARLLSDGRIEFAFTPTDRERITPQARYFPAAARVDRWLRSTEITIGPPVAPRYIAIATNTSFHTCAIRESAAIECWGRNAFGQADTPEGSYTAVSAGWAHTCAIRESGAIECWGGNAFGQADTPEGSYTAVSAGFTDTCAIRESGDLECWGGNWYGQADAPPGKFTAVSAGWLHTCAIRTSGEIECWGSNEKYAGWNAETQEQEWANAGQATPPAGTFTAVSVGTSHSCGLRTSGEIACWGNDESGQTNAPEGNFTAVSAGEEHTCGLRENGAIECWGDNEYGQVDTPTESGQQPYAGPRYTAVSAGAEHTCAIRESAAIECWGSNESWDEAGQYVGQSDPPPGRFTAVSASWSSPLSCGLRESGAIECWGNRGDEITAEAQSRRYTAISTGWFYACGLRENGETDCGIRGEPPTSRFSAVSTGGPATGATFHTCAIRESDSAIECWGDNEVALHMFNEETQEFVIESAYAGQATPPAGTFTAISAGDWFTCGLRTSGEIECWGYSEDRRTNAPEGSFTAVSAGGGGGCGLRSDGEIRCWGNASYSSKPVGRYTAISVGNGGACAILDTGAVRCWGSNSQKQTD